MSRRAPVRHTCPDIDRCIKWIKSAMQCVELAIEEIETVEGRLDEDSLSETSDNISKAKGLLGEALREMDIDRELEELRNSNSELRDWGHQLAAEIEELERELA